MMVKEARYVDDAANRLLPLYEPQPVALKPTSSKEALPSKVAQVEAAGFNEDEMAYNQALQDCIEGTQGVSQQKKTRGKCSCFQCSSIMLLYLPVMMLHLILMPCLHLVLHMLMVGTDLDAIMLLVMRLEKHQMDLQCFIKHVMLHLFCYAKMIK
jgi:hypothetical protein